MVAGSLNKSTQRGIEDWRRMGEGGRRRRRRATGVKKGGARKVEIKRLFNL